MMGKLDSQTNIYIKKYSKEQTVRLEENTSDVWKGVLAQRWYTSFLSLQGEGL